VEDHKRRSIISWALVVSKSLNAFKIVFFFYFNVVSEEGDAGNLDKRVGGTQRKRKEQRGKLYPRQDRYSALVGSSAAAVRYESAARSGLPKRCSMRPRLKCASAKEGSSSVAAEK